MAGKRIVAYFSMEIGLKAQIPCYSGGLGVLAGDTIRSAADLKIPFVAITLLHRKGYFKQNLDEQGNQTEEPVEWNVEEHLKKQDLYLKVQIEGRDVFLQVWKYDVTGVKGHIVPIYYLDSDLEENDPKDRLLTHFLYGGDDRYRLSQEVILGIGGVRLLRALGHTIRRYHMNEGHSSLLTLELLDEKLRSKNKTSIDADDITEIRYSCVFTTHTPVPAGHDKFPMELVHEVIGDHPIFKHKDIYASDHSLNMTSLALNLSGYINGVAKKHGEISRQMFSGYEIDAITNGVHAGEWTCPPFQKLFDKFITGWREDNSSLRYALNIPNPEIWEAHIERKKELFQYVEQESGIKMNPEVLTLGFARRVTGYKRADLLFFDIERLKKMARESGPLQILFAGKAHPQDLSGKDLIKKIFRAKEALKEEIIICYLNNYNMSLGKLLTSGVDLWLNNPAPPQEASGTSGMKAALNGVPSLSILDGWWIEGCIEGVTGWAIAEDSEPKEPDTEQDANLLYGKLEQKIIPLYYQNRNGFVDVMQRTIALNGSFFNTQRMMQEYVLKAYF